MRSKKASVNGSNKAPVPAAKKSVPDPTKKKIPNRDHADVWCVRYGYDYGARSLDASRKRAERREAARAKAEEVKTDKKNSVEAKSVKTKKSKPDKAKTDKVVPAPGFIERAATRRRTKQQLVDLRLLSGFRWTGGTFAGSEEYCREAFTSYGLISSRHPVLKLFVSKLHRAKHLRIGDDKAGYYASDSKLLACDAPYVNDNAKVCGVIRIEIDDVLPWTAIEDFCRERSLPLPNIVVGWQDAAGDVHNPHLLWLLHASLPMEGSLCSRFRGIYRGVLRGLTKAFLDLGADPGGLSNSHRHKNPLCPLWHRQILAEAPYDLQRIAQSVDVTVRMSSLYEAHGSRKGNEAPVADHPDAEIAVGSNALFRSLAGWARKEVVAVKAAGASEQEFAGLVAAQACSLAANLTNATEGQRAALAVAGRVSHWTWNDYRIPQPKGRITADEAALAARRADGARKVSLARRDKSRELIIGAAVELQRENVKVTQVAVLERVKGAGVTSERTVRRHWSAVLEMLAGMPEPDIRPPSVKKSAFLSSRQSLERSSLLESTNPGKLATAPVYHNPRTMPRPPIPAFLLVRQPAVGPHPSTPDVGCGFEPTQHPDFPEVPF